MRFFRCRRYFRPNSMTWWAGVMSILLGVLRLSGVEHTAVPELGRTLTMLFGGVDSSPAALIVLGLGLIGIRDKLERQ